MNEGARRRATEPGTATGSVEEEDRGVAVAQQTGVSEAGKEHCAASQSVGAVRNGDFER
jgi:hypothetical protein